MSNYEPVIGLEIHVELNTNTKIFCSCDTKFGGEPNSHCCPICLGLPGALPQFNKRVVEYGIKAGLALNCDIAHFSKFDRKAYFYPDLPKGYQISQWEIPICSNGNVEYELNDERLTVGITRAHLEEEVGKSVHSGDNILGSSYSNIDYNRAGIPLIEIVTDPDLRSPAQAKAFLEQLKSILQYAEISDCKMEEGSLRCDANVSLRPVNEKKFGIKTEIKNLNSFRAVERALEIEIKRQTKILDQNKQVVQETRAWDDDKGITVSMRTKGENRYSQEPDVAPIIVEANWIEKIKNTMPELPLVKKERFITQYSLPSYDCKLITQDKHIADFFEETCKHFSEPKIVSNWIMGELIRLINNNNTEIKQAKISPQKLANLLNLVKKGTISNNQGKEVLEIMFNSGKDADTVIKEKGFEQISDTDQLGSIIDEILAANPKNVEEYKAGKDKLLGFFVGQVMRQTKGKGNPKVINELIRSKLGK